MERDPGLAPGKSGFAIRRLDGFGIARVVKVGRSTGAAPARRSSQDRMLAVTSRPPFESWILRPVLPRHGPHYECGALLASATEELKWCSREDSHLELPPSQSGVQNSYTSGALNG